MHPSIIIIIQHNQPFPWFEKQTQGLWYVWIEWKPHQMDAIGCAWGQSVHLVSRSIFRWLISSCYFHDSFLLLVSYLLNLPCFELNKICSHFILVTNSPSSSQQMLIFLLCLSHTIQWKKSPQCLNLVLLNISIQSYGSFLHKILIS